MKVRIANSRSHSLDPPHYSKPQFLPSKTGIPAFYISKRLKWGLFFESNLADLISKRAHTHFCCSLSFVFWPNLLPPKHSGNSSLHLKLTPRDFESSLWVRCGFTSNKRKTLNWSSEDTGWLLDIYQRIILEHYRPNEQTSVTNFTE